MSEWVSKCMCRGEDFVNRWCARYDLYYCATCYEWLEDPIKLDCGNPNCEYCGEGFPPNADHQREDE